MIFLGPYEIFYFSQIPFLIFFLQIVFSFSFLFFLDSILMF